MTDPTIACSLTSDILRTSTSIKFRRIYKDRYQDTLAADAIGKVQKMCKYVNNYSISIIELLISIIHLLISIIHLLISIIHLLISIKMTEATLFIDINK